MIVAGSLAAASLVGAIHLVVDTTRFDAGAAALTAVGMVIIAVTAVSGVLLARGRWSQPVAAAVGASWIAIAASSPVSGLSLATIALAGLVLAGSLGPWLARWLRHRPSIEGPPPAAVVTLLLLLATPAAIGVASIGGLSPVGWSLAGWSVLLAFALARAVPGALSAARLVHPAASVAVGLTISTTGTILLGGLGVAVAMAAWRREVAIAIAPRSIERSNAVRIPPELAPPGVLDAAGVDESGKATHP